MLVKVGLASGVLVPVGVAVRVWVPVILGVGVFFPTTLIFLGGVDWKAGVGEGVGVSVSGAALVGSICWAKGLESARAGAVSGDGPNDRKVIAASDKYRNG
jgi:hypothetical protein